MRSATIIGLNLLAILLTACGGHGVASDPTLTVDPTEDRYLRRVSDIGNAGNGGNVPNLQANEVIAAGKLYCRVRSQHSDEHWSVGETAALQAVSKNYNIDGMQLDAVTQAALEILCPEAGNGASR